MTRRTFSFASLVFVSAPAVASDAAPSGGEGGVRLTSDVEVTPRPGALSVRLVVQNVSPGPIDVRVALGARPGADVRAFVVADGEDIELHALRDGADRREVVSRMGPRPRYEALAVRARAEVARLVFALPPGAERESFRIVAEVFVGGAAAPVALVHVVPASGRAGV